MARKGPDYAAPVRRILVALLVLVLQDGCCVTWAEMAAFYDGKIPKWCIPDAMVVVEELPHTATGKLQKARIRDMLRAGALPPALTA